MVAGTATATPKCAEGTVEMIRHTKIARDSTVKLRTQAIVTLKALIVTVPDELREQLQCLPKMALVERCAGLRPGSVTIVLASTKRSQRSLARRWLDLGEKSKGHRRLLGELTRQKAPNLVDAFGIGADTAAKVLVVVGGLVTGCPARLRPFPGALRPPWRRCGRTARLRRTIGRDTARLRLMTAFLPARPP
ncbi:hypothetical protein ACFCYB_37465 [Streptomyces sp. NPDC056309]|uniref:hypothetical protein n=1 Tax=unclassified Streptomyces TaxID=2593676 RepID=UPI0035D750A6